MQDVFGEKIKNPLDVVSGNSYGDVSSSGGGLISLVSNLIKFGFVVAGIFAVINIIIAGFMYVSGGDNPKITAQAWQKIFMSLLGLVVMAGALTIAAIVSHILYGDAAVILNPTIYGPGTGE